MSRTAVQSAKDNGTSMRRIAALYTGISHQHRSWNVPKYRQYISEILYIPDMTAHSLDGFDVVLVPSRMHAGLMRTVKPWLYAFAARGGIVVVFWPQPGEVVPGQRHEHRPTNFWWWLDKDATSGLALDKPDHPMFDYLTLEDCTWHQHGIFHPDPATSETLISIENDGPIFYIDKPASGGVWIVMSLDPEYHYGSYFMPATERFLDGFFPYIAQGEI